VDGVQGSPLVEITRHCSASFIAIESNKDRFVAIEGMIANLSEYRETDYDHPMRETSGLSPIGLGSLVYRFAEREPPGVDQIAGQIAPA
jgi:hypothetical protein